MTTTPLFTSQVIAKAHQLRNEGRVRPHPTSPGAFLVFGSSAVPYHVAVTQAGGLVTGAVCTCAYGSNRGAGLSTCSHVCAALGVLQEVAELEAAALGAPEPPCPAGETPLRADTFTPSLVQWFRSPAQTTDLEHQISEASEVVIDLETTGLDPWADGRSACPARVSCAALTLPRPGDTPSSVRSWVIPLSHPEGPFGGSWRILLLRLVELLAASKKPLTNHNIKFDLRWLHAQTGVDLSRQLEWDTQVAAHLMDENESTKLKEVVPRLFGVDRWDEHSLAAPGASEKVPLIELGLYAARDTYWTWRLAELQREVLFASLTRAKALEDAHSDGVPAPTPGDPEQGREWQQGLLADYVAMPMVANLTRIEEVGLLVDRERLDECVAQEGLAQEDSRVALEAHTAGYALPPEVAAKGASFAPTSLYFRGWAEAAVAAGDLEVISMTRTGSPQWDSAALGKLERRGFRVAGDLLHYRQATKRLEFLRSWLGLLTPQGTIHPSYHAGRVVSGRLSSSDPNAQQITKALKPVFKPRPGHLLAELDLSQIELRIAAYISRCEPMLRAYREGADLHRLLASEMTGKPLADVLPAERQHAKAGNFGFLYGMEAAGFVAYAENNYGVSIGLDQAVATRRRFFETWEGLEEWHHTTVASATKRGWVRSPIGRMRRLPGLAYGNQEDARKAINAPVQGFASDLMQIAATSIAGGYQDRLGIPGIPGITLVGTVHDSIVAEVPEVGWEPVVEEAMQRMIHPDAVLSLLGCSLDVPLGVEASIGTRWGLGDVGRAEAFGS